MTARHPRQAPWGDRNLENRSPHRGSLGRRVAAHRTQQGSGRSAEPALTPGPLQVLREVRCVRCRRPLNPQTEITDVQKHRLIRENIRSTGCFAHRHRHRQAVEPPSPGLRQACTSKRSPTCSGTARSASPETSTATPPTTRRAALSMVERSTGAVTTRYDHACQDGLTNQAHTMAASTVSPIPTKNH